MTGKLTRCKTEELIAFRRDLGWRALDLGGSQPVRAAYPPPK